MSLILIFSLGYLGIIFESVHKINKAAVALLTGIISWVLIASNVSNYHVFHEKLMISLADASGILFFLMGAMVLVELIDAHDGFDVLTQRINSKNLISLLWTISIVTFFLSSVLDNLTTTIVMVTLTAKIISVKELKAWFIGIIIIAANAGGAWSPIGDVTTTMLWIGGQVDSIEIIRKLLLPSLVCLVTPLTVLSVILRKTTYKLPIIPVKKLLWDKSLVLYFGLMVIIFVPIFKTLTGLPPFMGMLFGLSLMWFLTEILHRNKEAELRHKHSIAQALQRIDMPSILFFLGILLSVAALEYAGVLTQWANYLMQTTKDVNMVVFLIGLVSAVVDNVPLVAAAMGMFDLVTYPMNHNIWLFLAYCAGTGGSALIIGSAAGVAAMGLAKIDFIWYFKNITLLALLGYVTGALVYLLF